MSAENKGIRKLVEENKIGEAMANVIDLLDTLSEDRTMLSQINTRLNKIEQDKLNGTVSKNEIDLEDNRLKFNFLNFIGMLEEKINNVMSIKYDIKNFDEQVRLKLMQQYDVERKSLGEGSSAVIYRATDLNTKRIVAVRAMKSLNSKEEEENLRALIERASLLKHRNIIGIESYLLDDIPKCVIMEYIYGIRLDELLSTGAFPLRDAIRITRQLSEAVYYLLNSEVQRSGRFRPSKIIIDQELEPIISVFEIFRTRTSLTERSNAAELISAHAELRYVTPEEFFGQEQNLERDSLEQFLMGLIMYELITGAPLFKGNTLYELTNTQLDFFENKEYKKKKISELDVSKEIKAILNRLLSIKPEERYNNLNELTRALDAVDVENNPENDLAHESFMRCCVKNREFIGDFYNQFFAQFPEKNYQRLFQEIGPKHQNNQTNNFEVSPSTRKKMQKMVLQIIDFQAIDTPEKVAAITSIKMHSRLQKEDFINFLSALKTTISINDRLWKFNPNIEKAWDTLFQRFLEKV